MRRPDKMKAYVVPSILKLLLLTILISWTAVVQGAVIYGIEKERHSNMTFMIACPKSYGVLLNEVYSVHKFDARDKYTDSLTDEVMAHKQLTW
jgi:hypothetical protein